MFHKPTNQYRVVKTINKSSKRNFSETTKSHKKILREAEILKSLDHPNIVKIHEVLQSKNETALVLEYLPGKSLLEHLNNPLFQSYEAIAAIIEKILSALVYLHNKCLIHKDLKLENIIMEEPDPFSNLKLIDFGFTETKDKVYGRSSSGTIMYMASEVFTMNYNEKCDIWATGIILYLLLFKQQLFTGKTSEDIVQDIFNKDLNQFFEKKTLLCPEPLVIKFLQRLLERDPLKRYSAAEALNDPFIQKYVRKTQIQTADLELLKIYKDKTVTGLALSSIYVHNLMTKEENSKFIRIFKALDRKKNGFISANDFKSTGSSIFRDTDRLQISDGDQLGRIEMSNLMIACIDLNNRDILRRLFVFLDKDSDLVVKAKDIFEMLEHYVDIQIVNEVMNHFKSQNMEQVSFFLFFVFTFH